MTQSILFLTDPWSTLDHSQDTTLRFCEEAQKMGVSTFWSATDFLFDPDKKNFRVKKLTGKSPVEEATMSVEPSEFWQVHDRVDPPVDAIYRKVVDDLITFGVREKNIFNPPAIIKNQSEKIPPSALLHLAPRFAVVRNEFDLKQIFDIFRADQAFITKPMNMMQSLGVKKHNRVTDFSDFVKIVREETKEFTEECLIEEFLPEIDQGEVRMWFAFGNFVAALKKFPKSGDFRVLIDEGSKVEAYLLNAAEKKVAEEVGSWLKTERVAFAAIDFIGTRICDFNITSPGLLTQLERVHSQNFAKEIISILLQQR